MKVAVFGTGMVGQALAGKLAELGHTVTVGTRNVAATTGRSEPDGMGNPPFTAWMREHPAVRIATFAHAAAGAELIVNATSGSVSVAALQAAGEEDLAGKVLLDVTNPLDFAQVPPSLFVKDTDSLAEQIQRAFPQARVVKALNTMNASLMVNPRQLAGGDHSVFVSGDDDDSKQTVKELLAGFGHTDIIDLGDLSTARGTEMMLPLWLRLYGTLGTLNFNFKIVR